MVKVYWMDTGDLEDPGAYRECYGRLCRERREKVDACRLLKDKRLSLAAGMLLERGLEAYGLCASAVALAEA